MKFKALFYQNTVGFIAAIILFAFSLCSVFIDKKVAIALGISFVVILVIDFIYAFLSLKSTLKYVSAINGVLFGKSVENVGSFPMPAFMCDKSGNIAWFNKSFRNNVINDVDIRKISVKDFFGDFEFEKYKEMEVSSAVYGDKEYTSFIINVSSKSKPMLCFYLFDDTEYKAISREYNFSRPFVMMLLIDNIDQLSRQLSDSRFAVVLGNIEGVIEEWLKNQNVVLKRIGNGNYVVIGEKRNLDMLIEDKFSILNKIREYTYKDEPVGATLSAGVAMGENFAECEFRAKKALDMALSRGGDQTAIHSDNGYIYFGGVSNRTNDNSKVSPRQTAASIATLIKKYSKVIVVGHKFSDYDAIGSALGMHFFADAYGLEAYVVLDTKTTLSLPLASHVNDKGFTGFVSPSKAEDICDKNTVVIVVDTQRKQLLDTSEIFDKAGATVVIDHHRRSDDYISNANISYSSPSSSSTCEMVSELIQYSSIDKQLPSHMATALLAGIVLDTKDFVLRTSQRTFEAAGFLRDNGSDTVRVRKFFSIDADMASLKNDIIQSAKIYDGFMIGSTLSDSKNLRVITSSAADDMLNIGGVKASFVISKLGSGKYQISARSLGEENVQLIMERLSGGGHSTMAATQIKCDNVDEARDYLLGAINEYLKNK